MPSLKKKRRETKTVRLGQRIQRKRTKGWRMPAEAIYVGRPTQWGNPFRLIDYDDPLGCLRDYDLWLKDKLRANPDFLRPLYDRDLACWCGLDKPCHADVLLEAVFFWQIVVGDPLKIDIR